MVVINNHVRIAAAMFAAGMMAALGVGTTPAAAATDHAGTTAVLVAPGRGSAMLEAMRRDLDSSGAGPAAVRCWTGVSIESAANHRYVSAELGYSGLKYAMLRARAVEIQAWERFTVCRNDGNGRTNLRSEANNLLVSAEVGYGGADSGMLRARASVEGLWERYLTSTEPNGGNARFTLFALGNRTYVSAELGYVGGDNGMLRARALNALAWEQFNW